MSYISKIDPETAGEKEKEVIRDHLAQGYRLTNEKLTLPRPGTAETDWKKSW